MPSFYPKPAHSKNYQRVELMDLMVLLGNLWKGNQDRLVGFEDSEQTIQELTAKLNYTATLKVSDIESALWSCNLLNENEKFWHPKGLTFDEFVKRMLKDRTFNKVFNTVEEPKK